MWLLFEVGKGMWFAERGKGMYLQLSQFVVAGRSGRGRRRGNWKRRRTVEL